MNYHYESLEQQRAREVRRWSHEGGQLALCATLVGTGALLGFGGLLFAPTFGWANACAMLGTVFAATGGVGAFWISRR